MSKQQVMITQYSLKDLSAKELKALIDQFPGGDDADYAFFAALLDEYASRPESPQVNADGAKKRCMEGLGLAAEQVPPRSLSRRPIQIAIIAAAAAIVLAGSALAIGRHMDFFRNIFGVSSVVDAPTAAESLTVEPSEHSYSDEDTEEVISHTLPGYQLVEVDEAEADRLLGAYVKEMIDAHTYGNYTVTILGYIEDEAGTYRLYYSIENPNGLDNIDIYEYNGRTYMDYRIGSDLQVMTSGSWVAVDTRKSTETKIYACAPGTVWPFLAHGAEIQVYDYGGFNALETITETADKLVPAVVLKNEDYCVYVSPMGAKVSSLHRPEGFGFSVKDLSILMNDDTEFVVYQKDVIDNTTYISFGGEVENSASFCFNRLIDPETIRGVTVDEVFIPAD